MGKGSSLDRIAKSKGYLTEKELKDHGVSKAVLDDKGEEIPGMKLKSNLFGKGQRTITKKYRDGYRNTTWDKPKTQKQYEKLGFKVVTRSEGAVAPTPDKCDALSNGECPVGCKC